MFTRINERFTLMSGLCNGSAGWWVAEVRNCEQDHPRRGKNLISVLDIIYRVARTAITKRTVSVFCPIRCCSKSPTTGNPAQPQTAGSKDEEHENLQAIFAPNCLQGLKFNKCPPCDIKHHGTGDASSVIWLTAIHFSCHGISTQ